MKIKKELTYKHGRPLYLIKGKTFIFWYTLFKSYCQDEADKAYRTILRSSNVEKAY